MGLTDRPPGGELVPERGDAGREAPPHAQLTTKYKLSSECGVLRTRDENENGNENENENESGERQTTDGQSPTD